MKDVFDEDTDYSSQIIDSTTEDDINFVFKIEGDILSCSICSINKFTVNNLSIEE